MTDPVRPGTGQGARTGSGLTFAGAVAIVIFGLFPTNPGTGEPWTPELTMAFGIIAMKVGEWLAPWFASIRPGMRSLALCLAVFSSGPLGCASTGLAGGTKLDVFDTGGYADATATEKDGMMIYAEGGGTLTVPNPDPAKDPLVFTIAEGGILEVCIGPCLRASAQDQEPLGEAIKTLADKIPSPVTP